MMEQELFYPQVRATLGKYILSQGLGLEVYSSRDSYADWAKVILTEQYRDKIRLFAKEPASIDLGYNNVFERVFEGYVLDPGAEGQIILKDAMLLLEGTTITQTFLNTTPQEILSFCLAMSGVTRVKLTAKAFPVKKLVPVARKNVIGVIEAVHAMWGIKERFFFQEGVFYWGELPQQSKTYAFEYGVNILSLSRSGGVWELQTVSAPFIKHSHLIRVSHPQVTGVFEVRKVVFATNDSGFVRTNIYFGGNAGD